MTAFDSDLTLAGRSSPGPRSTHSTSGTPSLVTITLLRRLVAGERIWEAHRTHFYQRASDHGFSMLAVSGRVFGLNIVLAVLAGVTILWPQPTVQMLALAAGIVTVTLQLRRFAGFGGLVWG